MGTPYKKLFASGYPTHAICEWSIFRMIRQTICKFEERKAQMCWITSPKEIKRELGLKTCLWRQQRHSLLGYLWRHDLQERRSTWKWLVPTSLLAQTERWCNPMDQSILQLKDTAIHLLENTKQTDVNTTQNDTTHICEELQERQRPTLIIMLSWSNQKLKAMEKKKGCFTAFVDWWSSGCSYWA